MGVKKKKKKNKEEEEEEEEEEWRMHNVETRRHQHQPPKTYFPFVKLPSFSGESDPKCI